MRRAFYLYLRNLVIVGVQARNDSTRSHFRAARATRAARRLDSG